MDRRKEFSVQRGSDSENLTLFGHWRIITHAPNMTCPYWTPLGLSSYRRYPQFESSSVLRTFCKRSTRHPPPLSSPCTNSTLSETGIAHIFSSVLEHSSVHFHTFITKLFDISAVLCAISCTRPCKYPFSSKLLGIISVLARLSVLYRVNSLLRFLYTIDYIN